MKTILKILLLPIIFIISILQLFARLLVDIATSILSAISLITLVTSVFVYFNDGTRAGFVFSWLISPIGIPAIAQFIIELVSTVKDKLLTHCL